MGKKLYAAFHPDVQQCGIVYESAMNPAARFSARSITSLALEMESFQKVNVIPTKDRMLP
jgi:hypothetical protein